MRRPNVFSSSAIDRAHHLRRDKEALRTARRDPEAKVALVWRSKSLVAVGDPRPALLLVSELEALIAEIESTGEVAVPLVWLGVHRERPHFALDVSDLEEPAGHSQIQSAGEFVDLRQLGAIIEAEDGALLAYARAMMSWHRRHLYCGVCGAPTRSRDAGHLRVCTTERCAAEIFPRTDPAVIMLVHSDSGTGDSETGDSGTGGSNATASTDQCLLGRQAAWPPGVYSTLAGFVEPGESLEMAVAREVFEETGVTVSSADYHSSQPWPFPSSIMLGFYATAVPGEVSVDGDELEEARWFERDQLLELVARREVRFPPPMSIARRLIDDWLSGDAR